MHRCDISKGYLVTKENSKEFFYAAVWSQKLTALRLSVSTCVLYVVIFQEDINLTFSLQKQDTVIAIHYIKTKNLMRSVKSYGYILQDNLYNQPHVFVLSKIAH